MRETAAKIWIYIGLIVQSCLVSTVLALPLDSDPIQQQPINAAFKIQHRYYADWQLLQTSNSAGNLLPQMQFNPHSNQSATPTDEWRSWQNANQVGQRGGEANPYSNYENAYSESTLTTLRDALQLHMNDAAGGSRQSQRGPQRNRPHQGSSTSLIKSLLKTSLDEEQVERLLSITEPWQDASGARHFPLFGVGDFVIENRSQSGYNNGYTAPSPTYQRAQNYYPSAAPSQNRASSNRAQISLKEQLYEWIDKTIGWPMLYLVVIASGILMLGVPIIRFINSFSIQQ